MKKRSIIIIIVILYDPRHLCGPFSGQMAGPNHADRGHRRAVGLGGPGSIGVVFAIDADEGGGGEQREQRERDEYGGQHGDLTVPEQQRASRHVQQTGVQQTGGQPQGREGHRRTDGGPEKPERLQPRDALMRPVTVETVAHVYAAG